MIDILSTEELAVRMGYKSATSAFREWLVFMGITPVPGRRGFYDMALVRRRLDERQGLMPAANSGAPLSLVQQRRGRLSGA